MRRIDNDPIMRFGLDPAILGTAAGKDQRMDPTSLYHRELEVAAKWSR